MCKAMSLPSCILPSASTRNVSRVTCELSYMRVLGFRLSLADDFVLSSRPGISPKLESLLKLYAGKKIIIGRDKLDVVKGVVQKLRAFAKLLHDYPEWIGRVVLIQVTSPALSDSPKLERQVSELVSSINGEYGSLDFIPVHH
jgi:trehalose-6-phosphate synthase